MKILILPKTGIQESEKYAIERIEKKFPKEWKGYASLEIIDKGKLGREVDLVILTHDRVLLVELKRWNGHIKSEDGYWYLKRQGKSDYEQMDVSPLKKNNDKAKILKSIVARTISGGQSIFIDSCVVLCGRSPSPTLTEEEKPHVFQLEEFLEAHEERNWKRKFPSQVWAQNPIKRLTEFENLFRCSEHIRASEFSWQNFKVEGMEIFKHPGGIYKEYKAVNRDDHNSRALLRRWSFSHLGSIAPTQNDWVNIAHRESKVFSYLKSKTDALDGTLLQPIGGITSDEVTVDHCELFELPSKQKRLFDFSETFRDKLPLSERVSLTKVLISKFAELHRFGVAHRDIGDHCIWLGRPDSVRLSGFVAAHFPQMDTVGAIREQVSSISTKLPEDFFEDKTASNFHRDVFLLGVISHVIIFGRKPELDESLPRWTQPANDPTEGKLDVWFGRALSWSTQERWTDAIEMLDTLNDIVFSDEESVVSLTKFDYFQANTKLRDYTPIGEIVEKSNLEIFKAEKDGGICQIKVWYGLKPDHNNQKLNYELLRFLEKARAIQFNPCAWLPKIIDVGINNKGVILAREWLEYPTLQEWLLQEHSIEERLELSIDLLIGIERLHSINIFHGDIHPKNILVRIPTAEKATHSIVFIDAPDFTDTNQDLVTTAYAPGNYDRISIQERDRYSSVKTISEILDASGNPLAGIWPTPGVYAELNECLQAQPAILSLSPLHEAIIAALTPAINEAPSIVVTMQKLPAGISPGPMLSDNGFYYIEKTSRDDASYRLLINGPGLQLRLTINKNNNSLKFLDAEKLTHSNYQRKAFKAVPFEARLIIQQGAVNEAECLIAALFENNKIAAEFASPELSEVENENSEDLENDEKVRTNIRTADIWRHLIEAEIDALPEITVTDSPKKHPTRPNIFLVGFHCDVTLEYAPNEEVEIYRDVDGSPKRVGFLDHKASTSELLVIVPRGFSYTTQVGSRFTLRSKSDRSSYDRRHDAIDRILAGRGVIPTLVNCFERDAPPDDVFRSLPPTDTELDSYDVYEDGKKIFGLNEDQRNAFKNVVSSGPICLLQGPPGTGKTSFIAAFLHFVVHSRGAQSVLLVSQSHEATNNALEGALRLAERTNSQLDVVRVGEDGVLSDPIRHVGVAALQESYRERFRSEFKSRITALSGRLGLNQEFVEHYCAVMSQLTRLAEEVRDLNFQLEKGVSESSADIPNRINGRISAAQSIALTVVDSIGANDLYELAASIEKELISLHGIQNPDAVFKLSQLIRISREWVDVLGADGGNFEEFLAKTRTIVAGTCVGVGRWNLGVAKNVYDWVIIDEAARATPSELAVSMQVGRRILLVGDHFQLPPLYKDELKKEMSKRLGVARNSDIFDSDFQKAFESPYGKNAGYSLTIQYRMAPAICELVSKCFYEPRGKSLTLGRSKPASYYDCLTDEFRAEVTWVNTSDAGSDSYENDQQKRTQKNSTRNSYEAKKVVDVLYNLLSNENFVEKLVENLNPAEIPIGIIAMYSAQVLEITTAIAKAEWLGPLRALIKVDTVDSYQGKENRIVILSLVRNNPSSSQGFLSSPNRLNVGMSRAMDRLIIVGAMSMWEKKNTQSPLASVVRFFRHTTSNLSIQVVESQNVRGQ